MFITMTFVVDCTPVGHMPMFGYGMGTTMGPAGVLQTSGKPRH